MLVLAMLLAGCRGRNDDASTIAKDPSTASTSAQPPPGAVPDAGGDAHTDADAGIVLPPIDTSCTVDADCAVTFSELSGPTRCCARCGSTAGNVAWVKKVDAICKAAMPWTCPPLACPAGPMHARCDKGTCVGKF
jgi:hypothetical protein